MMMTAHMVTPRRDSAQAFSGIDYRRLHEMAAELDRPVGTMLALASDNDPFFADREQRRHGAQWFAKLWRRLRLGAGVHLRRIHYVFYQLVLFAYTLMSKGRYSVISDNPESIKRYRAFAQHIGATAENTQSELSAIATGPRSSTPQLFFLYRQHSRRRP